MAEAEPVFIEAVAPWRWHVYRQPGRELLGVVQRDFSGREFWPEPGRRNTGFLAAAELRAIAAFLEEREADDAAC